MRRDDNKTTPSDRFRCLGSHVSHLALLCNKRQNAHVASTCRRRRRDDHNVIVHTSVGCIYPFPDVNAFLRLVIIFEQFNCEGAPCRWMRLVGCVGLVTLHLAEPSNMRTDALVALETPNHVHVFTMRYTHICV